MIEIKLTAETVYGIFSDCLFRDGEPTDGHVLGPGVMLAAGFHPERLAKHKEEIRELLLQLPDEFMASKGGGMSFLNACNTREGEQWGEHRNMDQLLMLGTAAGLAKILLPREVWRSLPGGMPYFSVVDTAVTEEPA